MNSKTKARVKETGAAFANALYNLGVSLAEIGGKLQDIVDLVDELEDSRSSGSVAGFPPPPSSRSRIAPSIDYETPQPVQRRPATPSPPFQGEDDYEAEPPPRRRRVAEPSPPGAAGDYDPEALGHPLDPTFAPRAKRGPDDFSGWRFDDVTEEERNDPEAEFGTSVKVKAFGPDGVVLYGKSRADLESKIRAYQS